MKKIVEWFEYIDWDDVLLTVGVVLLIAISIAFIALICVGINSSLENASNEIYSGVVVDKYISGGTRTYVSTGQNNGYYVSSPKAFKFVIEGQKGESLVQYAFEVTEEEYDRYKIGDWYER